MKAMQKTGAITFISGQTDNTNDAGLLPIDLELSKSVNRSEERRVGKEGRSGRLPNNKKEKGVSTATGVTVKDVMTAGLDYVSSTGRQRNTLSGDGGGGVHLRLHGGARHLRGPVRHPGRRLRHVHHVVRRRRHHTQYRDEGNAEDWRYHLHLRPDG